MNKNLLYVAGGIVVIVVIGLIWFFMQGNGTKTNVQSSTSTAPSSLKSLMAMGKPQKCTFTDSTSGATGTMYIGGGKARGDFSVTTNGKMMGTHMIADGSTSYVWMDGSTSGFKTSMTTQANTDSTSTTQNQGIDADKAMDYHCSTWTGDSSEFQLPVGITFTDMSAMMNTGSSTNTSGANCSMCNQVPAAQQAQCKAALGCK